ncbi:MAG: metallophosphoesterase [Opitutaceae bacterium]|jgi:manganese-dependent ADP-ribose/CDP-alcohol diphosphatase|nr:metallophosphoesterase [Opitutaceae bacterium]
MTKPTYSRRGFLGATMAAPFIARGATRELFSIGLVADAQYADVPDKGTRFYRASIGKLGAAVEHFNRTDLVFCAHLGDLIDREWRSFDEIMRPLAASRHRWHQVLGNHDFEVLEAEKPRVPGRLGMKGRHGAFDHDGFRFVVLDTNDLSTYAHPVGAAERAAAERELTRLQAAKVRQAKPWNGGVSAPQLAWLERELAGARSRGQRVIVFAHHPVWPDNDHNVWNAPELLAILDRHPHLVAWLNGHNHAGAFGERHGVPFVTLKGMVETAATTAYALARILPDRLILEGQGREPSRELKFRLG